MVSCNPTLNNTHFMLLAMYMDVILSGAMIMAYSISNSKSVKVYSFDYDFMNSEPASKALGVFVLLAQLEF